MSDADLLTEDGKFDVETATQFLDDFEAANRPVEIEQPEKPDGKEKTPGRQRDEKGRFQAAADENETDASADEGNAEADDTAAGDKAGGDEWAATDEAKELLSSLEISEDEAREFSGLEELQRHAKLLDKRFYEEGKQAAEASLKQGEEEKPAKQEAKETGQDKSDEEAGFKSKLDPDEFDENVIGEFERVGTHVEERIARYEKRLEEMESRYKELIGREARKSFDMICDSLDQDKLLGSADSPNREARDKLHDAVETFTAGLKARGKPADVTPALVKRALNVEFAEEIEKQRRDSFAKTVRKQSSRKLGGGGTRPADRSDQVWKGDPTRDPVLLAAHAEMEKESGARA